MKIKICNLDSEFVTVYCDNREEARHDQSILGCRWECPFDMDVAYAVIDDQMDLVTLLEKEGYEVDDSEYFPTVEA